MEVRKGEREKERWREMRDKLMEKVFACIIISLIMQSNLINVN